MSLYKKYRPQTFNEIAGNKKTVSTLEKMVGDIESLPHAFLLTGPTGCGKTTLGRIIAKEIGINGNDYREIDTADFRGIDTIREIRNQMQYMPLESDRRAWLIDECHQLSKDAQNAILKMLEETPDHVYFILCTTDPQKLLPTIKGRCSHFEMELLEGNHMKRLLKQVTRKEEEELEEEVIQAIIQDSGGHARNALQILEQVLRAEEEDRLAVAKRTAERKAESIELCRTLIGKQGGWKKVRTILTGLKDDDPESIRRHVMGYASAVLLSGENDRAALVLEEFVEPFYNTGFPGLVFACYSVIKG